jgi:hypothetical protein
MQENYGISIYIVNHSYSPYNISKLLTFFWCGWCYPEQWRSHVSGTLLIFFFVFFFWLLVGTTWHLKFFLFSCSVASQSIKKKKKIYPPLSQVSYKLFPSLLSPSVPLKLSLFDAPRLILCI